MRQRDGEAWPPASTPSLRRSRSSGGSSGIEARPLGAKAAVLVTRAASSPRRGRDGRSPRRGRRPRALAALDLLPGVRVVRHVVAEADVASRRSSRAPSGHAARSAAGIIGSALRTYACQVDGGGFRIVPREDGVDVRRPLEGGALARHQRDRPALAVAVHLWPAAASRRRGPHRRSAGRSTPQAASERVPLPETRVDLHQLEPAVARIALELHLRQAEVAERVQQAQRRVDGLLHPDGLADAARADAGRRLPQLAAGEDAERPAVAPQVAADGVERVVAAGNQLLHHRPELLRVACSASLDLHRASRSGTPAAGSAA